MPFSGKGPSPELFQAPKEELGEIGLDLPLRSAEGTALGEQGDHADALGVASDPVPVPPPRPLTHAPLLMGPSHTQTL